MRHPLCPGEAGIPVALLSRMRIAFAFAQRFAGSTGRTEVSMKRSKRHFPTASGLVLAFGVAAAVHAAPAAETYVAKLVPLNAKAAGGEARGEARFAVSGDTLTIEVNAQGLPPGMAHMQHLHGFVDGRNATCPGANADVNHDGVVDLRETEAAAGVTLVPLNGDPATLKIASDTYPVASKDGKIRYTQRVSLKALDAAMAKADHDASVDLGERVLFLHGVPDRTALPRTAASLPGVPAQMTLPIACGKLVVAK